MKVYEYYKRVRAPNAPERKERDIADDVKKLVTGGGKTLASTYSNCFLIDQLVFLELQAQPVPEGPPVK